MTAQKRFIAATTEYSDYGKNVPAPYMRGAFQLKKIPKAARLRVTALGFYDVFVNGQCITKGIMAPYISNPEQIVVVDEYDIRPFLREGENVLGLVLGNGFTNAFSGFPWDFQKDTYRAAPKTWFSVEADGEEIFSSAGRVKCAPSPLLRDDLREGEIYDARREIAGWNLPGFDASGWQEAIAAKTPEGEFAAADFPPISEYKRRKAVSVIPVNDGYVYDFGVNTSGVPVLKIDGKAGQTVELVCGEWLRDGKMDTANIQCWARFLSEYGDIQRVIYTCKGEKGEGYAPRFSYYGCRYVKVKGVEPDQLTDDLVTFSEQSSAMKKLGAFHCSDEYANKTFTNTLRSDFSNFFYFPTDCPHREKNGWTGDISLSAEQFALLLDCESSLRMWLKHVRAAQRENGSIPCVVPTGAWGYDWGNGPSWDAVLTRVPYYLYRYRGNRAVLEENADAIYQYLGYLRSIVAESGMIEYGLGDWCQVGTIEGGHHSTPAQITNTVSGMDICDKAAQIFRVLGQNDRAAEAAALYSRLRAAVRRVCLDDKGTPVLSPNSRTQTAVSMMLRFGVYEEAERETALYWLKSLVNGAENRMQVGVIGVQSLLRVLCENGLADLAYEIAMSPDRVSYGSEIAHGATSLWEFMHTFKKGTNEVLVGRMRSLNHHFWGDIAAWYITYLAGIRVNEGFFDGKEVNIEPYFPAGLAYASARHETPLGEVQTGWQRTGENKISLYARIPQGMHGKLILHDGWSAAGNSELKAGGCLFTLVKE